ncbi:helix-turn-helix transcriptional regulator [Burkholderia gladioli]|uniref:helix-turn-helix transcriptional regulator n=1 Tax=Burkholderia gladioli TaxID=28095 RepID=UPI001FC81C14|nr:helix-turn-helix transcriptional regulator [Burkholderia gladioli]
MFGMLGKVISSTGTERFTSDLRKLLIRSVPICSAKVTAWSVDKSAGQVVEVRQLGAVASREQEHSADFPGDEEKGDLAVDPLSRRIIAASDIQLIHINHLRICERRGGFETTPAGCHRWRYECHLVSPRAHRRYVISLYRVDPSCAFSLQEMSFLKSCGEVLLPLVEKHAAHPRFRSSLGVATCVRQHEERTREEPLRLQLQHRLSSAAGVLSEREIEVCVGLLTGSTFREMAEVFSVKPSTVKTYLRRAADKLGFKGRHGLVKWALDRS